MFKIVKDGSFWRAESEDFKSHICTSASQAGMVILRKFGQDAYEEAYSLWVEEHGQHLTMSREEQEKAVWKKTHKDYKGTTLGCKTIMIMRKGSTTLVPLTKLTENEIHRILT